MKNFRPDYFDKFKCIADKCDFTCCRDWTIAVDDNTYTDWKTKGIADHVEEYDGGRRIILDNGKCPYLCDNGLCSIVNEYGEECLSKTCHTYPREKHLLHDRVEETLTLSCKAVIDLLWKQDSFNVVECSDEEFVIGESDGEKTVCPKYLYNLRDWFIKIANDKTLSINDALKVILYIALDVRDKEIESEEELKEYRNTDILSKLIPLVTDETQKTDSLDRFIENNELLLDLFIRYYEQKKYLDHVGAIYERAEKLEQDIDDGIAIEIYEKYLEWLDSRYEEKLRIIVAEELWSTLIVSYADIETMIVKIEWLAIELAVLRQWMFLYYDVHKKLDVEDLLQIVAVLFRITGYCDDDIIEYLEDSFEEIIWDWGYIDLIL